MTAYPCPVCGHQPWNTARTATRQAHVLAANQAWAAGVLAEARRILAALPPDPDAARHRLELDRELRTRKAKP